MLFRSTPQCYAPYHRQRVSAHLAPDPTCHRPCPPPSNLRPFVLNSTRDRARFCLRVRLCPLSLHDILQSHSLAFMTSPCPLTPFTLPHLSTLTSRPPIHHPHRCIPPRVAYRPSHTDALRAALTQHTLRRSLLTTNTMNATIHPTNAPDPDVFAIGDDATIADKPLPATAGVANQQAKYLADSSTTSSAPGTCPPTPTQSQSRSCSRTRAASRTLATRRRFWTAPRRRGAQRARRRAASHGRCIAPRTLPTRSACGSRSSCRCISES